MRKVISIICGILTVITAWSTIKMILAIISVNKTIEVSYAPLPISLTNPSNNLIIVSLIVYIIITIILGIITLKLFKGNRR
ncbi:hypothetical protein [Staphylococcus pettenkoferi]|uniref:Uncharacterized protein n=1 Tax=Staphylococcus pettenkoferi TaxID=170573 RepID=A0ABT4BJC5_9STAP|nr:hypothetical protein [Staphylococcus pettenkoferi]MCY1582776.1 hypothetical protein [Staphylococcus pettenkoferi]MCY1598151.1 hypothetical protein [Staphylococcus pettenkoferi]MCY1606275.1 hypothetical protein [Staphylococcus pettenkoferi]MCY1610984.1 hypothetical protein [Staphylococcus pettenkoferi]MDH9616787.1 hypothetical protein [Staphylococcus pettenkoferi]